MEDINDIVRFMTAVSYRTSRLVQLFVLELLQNNRTVPDLSYEKFMRQCFNLVATGSHSDHQILNQLYDRHIRWDHDFDVNHLPQIISNTSRDYATNCMVHVSTNVKNKAKQWYTNKLLTKCPFLNRKQCYHLFEYRSPHTEAKLSDRQKLMVSIRMHHLDRKLNNIMESLPLQFEEDDGDEVENENGFKRWWEYLRPLSRLLCYFEKKKMKTFHLVPHTRLTSRYIRIDTDAYYGLLRRSDIANVPSLIEFRRDTDTVREWWKTGFKIEKLETVNKQFGFSISTDGLGCSVSMLKKVHKRDPNIERPNSYGFLEDGTYVPLEVPGTLVAHDLGRNDIFSGTTGMEEDSRRVCCSSTEYRHRCGFSKAEKTRTKWIKRRTDVNRIQQNMPSGKTACFEKYANYVLYMESNVDILLQFYSVHKWKRLRFKNEISKQKFEKEIVNRMTNGDNNAVVILGNGGFAHNSRGRAATPTKRLRRLLTMNKIRWRLIDEFRTSITCSLCEGELSKKSRYWQVKVCNDVCLTCWNRDVNAARNIFKIFVHMQENDGARPYCMRRNNR